MEIYRRQLINITEMELPWEKLAGKTVIISGASGMIGKCLIDLLMLKNRTMNRPLKIIAISRNEITAKQRLTEYLEEDMFHYISCDVNQGIPDCGDADYVIHAASNTHPLQYSKDPIGTITANVTGTKNLLDYAVTHKAKLFCFLSSVEIYGENRGDKELFDEKYTGYLDCNTLRAGYPESKRVGEALCNAYKQSYGLDFVIPRLSRIYGSTMLESDSKAISQFIKKAASKENIVLKSEGTQKFSYTFVTDAVSGILFSMLRGKSGEAYNVADNASDITLKDLAEYLARLGESDVVFEQSKEYERKGYSMATKAMLDTAKIKQLGWEPLVHLEEGLRCTVESYRRRLNL